MFEKIENMTSIMELHYGNVERRICLYHKKIGKILFYSSILLPEKNEAEIALEIKYYQQIALTAVISS